MTEPIDLNKKAFITTYVTTALDDATRYLGRIRKDALEKSLITAKVRLSINGWSWRQPRKSYQSYEQTRNYTQQVLDQVKQMPRTDLQINLEALIEHQLKVDNIRAKRLIRHYHFTIRIIFGAGMASLLWGIARAYSPKVQKRCASFVGIIIFYALRDAYETLQDYRQDENLIRREYKHIVEKKNTQGLADSILAQLSQNNEQMQKTSTTQEMHQRVNLQDLFKPSKE